MPPVHTRGFRDPTRLGRIRLTAPRAPESTRLDQIEKVEPVPYAGWHQFYPGFRDDFRQGDHVLLLGRTRSGKTTLAVDQILRLRRYVVVLATKSRDPSLYDPLLRQGFVMAKDWDEVDIEETPKVIFRPTLGSPTAEGREQQRTAFQQVLIQIFEEGGWCVYMDEIRYLTDNLNLRTEIETLYLQGRSLGISMIGGTQRPRSIPLVVFDQATHIFTWRLTDREDAKRASEFLGVNYERARLVIPQLPPHEFLYDNAVTDKIVRSKLIRRQ